MKIKLTYMSGAGNNFTFIDNRKYRLDTNFYSQNAGLLCKPENGLIIEGLIVIDNSESENFHADFYNPDGSCGMMCGNGGRCSAMFAVQNGIIKTENAKQCMSFEMSGSVYKAKLIANDEIELFLPPPSEIINNLNIDIDSIHVNGGYVNINSDHAVINIDEFTKIDKSIGINTVDLITIGKSVRYSKQFAPKGVNVNIYDVVGKNIIKLRTYERGVEAETGACGTGACSTAIISYLKSEVNVPVEIIPPSGKRLIIVVDGFLPNNIVSIRLSGSAEIIGESIIEFQ